MKSRILFVVLAVCFSFALLTCTADTVDESVPQARLLSLIVEGMEVPVIPEPISGVSWDDDEFIVGGADTGLIIVKDEGESMVGDNVRLEASASPGARVLWGLARLGNRPDSFTDTRVRANFDYEDYLYLKVISKDGGTVNYYRFTPSEASPVNILVNLTIAGRDPVTFGNANPVMDMEALPMEVTNMGRVSITRKEATKAVVIAEPQDETSKIRYALATRNNLAPGNFSENNVFDFDTGDSSNVIYIEVTAQNEKEARYYAFIVNAAQIARIAKIEFDKKEVVAKGTEHGQFGSVGQGSYSTADQSMQGLDIKIILEDSEGDFDYALINSTSAALPTTWQKSGRIKFDHQQALAVRVFSARGNSVDTRYYKIQINLLAANFLEHPESAAYYHYKAGTMIGPGDDSTPAIDWYTYNKLEVGAGKAVDPANPLFDRTNNSIKPLSFKLDREGSFTYQWYESNSWYGGYGFDADGRVSFIDDNGVQHTEAGFVANDTYRKNLDEKNNISLHNGGNQFYMLPTAGRAIQGATGQTYTPDIDKRPFISGFTHQSHYYWVVVTGTIDGKQVRATSMRAAIISERDPRKKHHIVDLNAYLKKDAIGLRDTPMNTQAFTFHREKRIIPVTFPTDFNVMDYSTAVIQARFYLADGTPWIQNWTQGDVGFERNGEGQVLFYNLTNNNATVGLSGDSKEPQGANLIDTPTHIVVKPAGEKPPKQMPPLNANGTPVNTGDAQGWFTPFIELVEVRFIGPPRTE